MGNVLTAARFTERVLVSVLHKLGLEVRMVNAEVDVEPLEFVCGYFARDEAL